MQKSFLASLIAALLVGLAGCGGESPAAAPGAPAQAPANLEAAWVYVGPVGDGGWTWAHDQGRKAVEKELPWLRTSFVENVPEGADSERVITQFAARGAKVVFTTSFGYMDPTLAVAGRFPDTIFLHCSGYKRAKNMGTYFGKMYQPLYVAGLVAARASKTGKLGYIGAHPIPEDLRHINAFAIGARSVNPAATVRVVWTNTWFDPGKEKEAAAALFDAGCDVITQGTDSVAPLQVAEERGKLAIGYDSDARRFAPKAFLTAAVWDWAVYYRKVLAEIKAGTWVSGDVDWGMESGLVGLAPYSDLVPPEVRAEAERAVAAIKAGTLKVFAGPLAKQDGSVAVAAGAVATDAELAGMGWFVQGVEGTIPAGGAH